MIQKISAVTFRVASMKVSVRFYRDALGMQLLYGGGRSEVSSFRGIDPPSALLNLQHGAPRTYWGPLVFYVEDGGAGLEQFRVLGFMPASPRDASWGERYFHMLDPDGHELSFARPLS